MRGKLLMWMFCVIGILILTIPAAMVMASKDTPDTEVIPMAGTPGSYNNADKVDFHHAGPSNGTKAQRKNRVLWAKSDGRLHWKAMPQGELNKRYLNDDRQETLKASVPNAQGHGAVLKVKNTSNGGAIFGEVTFNYGVYGYSYYSRGVYGYSPLSWGVYGQSDSGIGVTANSQDGNIIEGWDGNPTNRRFVVDNAGVVTSDGGFNTGGADFAEMLSASEGLEPGDVLVIGDNGILIESTIPNAPNVAGVYSTSPALTGGSGDDTDLTGKVPVAIVGVVPTKVSTENGSINSGDVLTSSSIPGYAMKASPVVAGDISFYLPSTILGKALEPLEEGTGLIRVLVTLQ